MTVTDFPNQPVPITVYGKPGCQGCKMTVRHLDKQGTPHQYRDVTTDPAAHEIVQALGYKALPVVTAGGMHWSGYSPDRLNTLGRVHAFAPDLTSRDELAANYLGETA
ncbi:NrdH-redoxin [Rhodococcus hoagii]|uniref:glutaredoxin family protein n=1 Tax=Rhodococcus hoagii TaxID=43767 RepID=UPI001F30D345|nr:glutaredoxin family protein [Prescottella equi]MBP0080147.1 NrdH-redoxin [Prescottella equi]